MMKIAFVTILQIFCIFGKTIKMLSFHIKKKEKRKKPKSYIVNSIDILGLLQ